VIAPGADTVHAERHPRGVAGVAANDSAGKATVGSLTVAAVFDGDAYERTQKTTADPGQSADEDFSSDTATGDSLVFGVIDLQGGRGRRRCPVLGLRLAGSLGAGHAAWKQAEKGHEREG
jgi:hypothetical protein